MLLFPAIVLDGAERLTVLLQVDEHPSLVTVTVEVPATFTEMQRVVSPLLHK